MSEKKKSGLKDKVVILVDSREPSGLYLFKKQKDVVIIKDALRCGDFSVFPYGDNEFFVERKSLSDLAGSFTAGRERFEAEWKRANPTASKFLLIEGDLMSIILGDYRSNFNPASFLGSLFSWSIKYKFSIIFVKNHAEGQLVVYWLCREYRRNRELQNKKEAKNGSE
jgi:ERCC4-type nuclease